MKNIKVTVTEPPISTELMQWMEYISCTKEYSWLSISFILNSWYHLTIRFNNIYFRMVRYIEIDYHAQCIKIHCFPLIQLPFLANIQFSYACSEVHIVLVLLYNAWRENVDIGGRSKMSDFQRAYTKYRTDQQKFCELLKGVSNFKAGIYQFCTKISSKYQTM